MVCRTNSVVFYGALALLNWITVATTWAQSSPMISVVPRPARMEIRQGNFVLSAETKILADTELQVIGRCLSEQLQPTTGYALPVENAGAQTLSARTQSCCEWIPIWPTNSERRATN